MPIIKLDVEGNEINVIDGALNFIKNTSPLIIIEFSKFTFDIQFNINYLKDFLVKYDYSIYNDKNEMLSFDIILVKLKQLKKNYKTIGNYYLIKNSSKTMEEFLSNE